MRFRFIAYAACVAIAGGDCLCQALTTKGLPEEKVFLHAATSMEAQTLLRTIAPATTHSFAPSGQELINHVLLVNKGAKLIIGYTIDWTVTDAVGAVTHRYTSYFTPGMGDTTVRPGSFVLGPGDSALLSPSRRVPISEIQSGAIRRQDEPDALPGSTRSVLASLDDVIYADSTYAGPDHSEHILHTRMDWNASHDSGVSALKAAAKYSSDDELKKYLEQYPSKREPANGDPSHDLYYEARERATARLLFALNTLGRQSLLSNAKSLAAQKQLVLTPVSIAASSVTAPTG